MLPLHGASLAKAVSKKFGGAALGLYPSIDRKKHHHSHHFLFPALDNNPDAPRKPGDSGLLYRTKDECPWKDDARPVKLFVKFETNDYRYLGDYQTNPVMPLESAEYKALPYKV